ncbi:MAG: Adenine specific DNA methyltransferase [Ignavibacteria bacterium]|nr:MAG: Adenine specific DNA methyltransferase [Ignavibacteria bacterium]KAF0158884.1 MAG: Adenine specific DNA methyltransferase [Ignavibacteria bacterium]
MAKVYHSEIFGLRETKYDWLNKHNIKNVKWNKIYPSRDFYLFMPTDNKLANYYYSFEKITEIFPVNSVGIVTARDKFVIDFDRKKLERRLEDFRNPKIDDEILKQTYDLSENKSWKINEQREKLRKDFDWKDSITKILYRPFDERWVIYNDDMVERTRKEIMQNLMSENIALITSRMTKGETFKHAQVTDKITEVICVSPKTSNNGFVFPLYLYLKKKDKKKTSYIQMMMFEPEAEYQTRQPNINPSLFEEFKKSYKKDVTPEEIFYYIYAVLYSNTYRTKYVKFLKIDFPRVPFTKNYKLFIQLGKLGKQLADLHLLKSEVLDKSISEFPIEGNNKVEKPHFGYALRGNGKVWINKEQYFDGIKEEVWQYQIGGYQVCEKWLKGRKEKTLTLEEIQTYCKIVTALSKTIEVQIEIDKYYESIEKSL